ncbi:MULTISPECIES: hypothetical protein [unclassified Mesorhizobium]|uniref:hypothetical protein n=1 Tax=unclassified Mesorhizobium TaxID=325217 RepID=UPI000424D25B|nr:MULTISPECIES: hypothetical protein [unclassified Mesorhizobium]
MRTTSDTIAAIGLAIGGVFGLAGTFVASAPLRETLWAIEGVALVVATALLTMKYQRLGNECVAAGFLTFLVGESLIISGNAAGLEASVPSYVGGISLWAAALFLIGAANTLRCGCGSPACHPVCRDGGHGAVGRALAADFGATARRRLSVPGADFRRLDMDVAEVAEVIDAIRRLAPHVKWGQ